ncbi:spermidine synthase [Novosphingobium chloroacetimidivorans]|uniref:Spermidine synthase n=1 Tax=Novosphingobium chloroacetimidivorans TaxID=1428314 RepID=A0A7W7NW01_9SPHN|nr:fused MFS/spermidine synthase [Novosphingobium chloroacetimidivorans]MBB4857884.1 spermidine synthase [Novosphingobium chloroacetimidivorans]
MSTSARRPLFVATILAGSFLLFLVQPMVARMALPRLGGAPNVWNSAMVVYQALLLAGYGYAHGLSKLAQRRQIVVHLALLALAALTLPIVLANLSPPASGWEVLWVPLLLLATVGPVFVIMSAQAPLMQRWYSAAPDAGEPWALYAASNIGSFAGLLAYPLLAEPLLSLHDQSLAWSLGYGLLFVLVALAARARWNAGPVATIEHGDEPQERIGARRVLLWLALSAVPSGLLLSTSTHLTTDIFAMPLLWVIPLGLYLLSFVFAFSDRRAIAHVISIMAPAAVIFAGSFAMVSTSAGTMAAALAALLLLFEVSVALHARLYDSRPGTSRLTFFYLVMSAGGAMGGAFTALVAPVVFDWVWEHPILILASAMLLPLPRELDWRRMGGLDRGMSWIALAVLLVIATFLTAQLMSLVSDQENELLQIFLLIALTGLGLLLLPWRWAYVLVLTGAMLAQGGVSTFKASLEGQRTRSYFGIYNVYDNQVERTRLLAHGTTLHGKQSLDLARRREATTYYGDTSGVGLALEAAPRLFGAGARIGVVGLGSGTLTCRHKPGQTWTVFEIDPAIVRYSRDGTFTFLQTCAPDAQIVLGDARLELEKVPRASLDVLAVDAFSSDAIPLHLLTDEAVGVYEQALAPDGLLLIHISNRFIDLEPVLSAIAAKRGLVAMIRRDTPKGDLTVASNWVVLARSEARLARLRAESGGRTWNALDPATGAAWTDDHASVLPYIRWGAIMGKL